MLLSTLCLLELLIVFIYFPADMSFCIWPGPHPLGMFVSPRDFILGVHNASDNFHPGVSPGGGWEVFRKVDK